MIAEACGTSIGTVDRALNNRADINPETKRLILNTAASLGYKADKLAAAGARKGKLHLAFIFPDKPEGFYSCITMGIEKAAAELAPYGAEFELLNFDATNPAMQLELLAKVNAKDYDGIAMNPISTGCTEFINNAVAAGVPVVTFNNDLPNSSRLFYVGSNSQQAGRMAGEILGVLLGGEGGVTVLGNFVQTMPFFERFEGFCQVISQRYPNITIYSSPDCRLDTDLTAKNMFNLMEKAPDIKGIFCTGYSSTMGAVEALKRSGRNDISILGYDVSTETASAVTDGWIKALLYQDPYQQGYQIASLLSRHILQGWTPVKSQLFIETRVAFRQNIENYIGGVMQWDLSI